MDAYFARLKLMHRCIYAYQPAMHGLYQAMCCLHVCVTYLYEIQKQATK